MRKVIIAMASVLFLISCGKQEGEGGKNTITGVIIKEEWTKNTNQFVTEYPASEERIYIIYGDNAYFANEVKTNYDGSFRFEFLYKGDYQIFVYSECLACPGGVEPLFVDIKLTQHKEIYVIDTLLIRKYIN